MTGCGHYQSGLDWVSLARSAALWSCARQVLAGESMHLQPQMHARSLTQVSGLLQAVFQVSLDLPAGQHLAALSNTAPLGSSPQGAFTRTTFAPTPVMSPYLLAVCVGRLAALRNGAQMLPLSPPRCLFPSFSSLLLSTPS